LKPDFDEVNELNRLDRWLYFPSFTPSSFSSPSQLTRSLCLAVFLPFSLSLSPSLFPCLISLVPPPLSLSSLPPPHLSLSPHLSSTPSPSLSLSLSLCLF